MNKAVTTIQQTGKGPKVAQVIGFLLICVGVLSWVLGDIAGMRVGIWVGLAGIALYAWGRFTAWWRHG